MRRAPVPAERRQSTSPSERERPGDLHDFESIGCREHFRADAIDLATCASAAFCASRNARDSVAFAIFRT